MKFASTLLWALLAVLGAIALALVTGLVHPHEKVNGLWLVVATGCIFVLAYRFYGRWLARRVLELNNQRVTPAVRLNDGVNFHPTNKVVLFGHHFAAIAGAGPLLGPVLAAQFGFLPGFLWLVIGAVLAGAVQDFIILVASMRRNGRSLPAISTARRKRKSPHWRWMPAGTFMPQVRGKSAPGQRRLRCRSFFRLPRRGPRSTSLRPQVRQQRHRR